MNRFFFYTGYCTVNPNYQIEINQIDEIQCICLFYTGYCTVNPNYQIEINQIDEIFASPFLQSPGLRTGWSVSVTSDRRPRTATIFTCSPTYPMIGTVGSPFAPVASPKKPSLSIPRQSQTTSGTPWPRPMLTFRPWSVVDGVPLPTGGGWVSWGVGCICTFIH